MQQQQQLEDRTINVKQFIEARSDQIIEFKKFLDTKNVMSTKLLYQQAPKHIRRRAMSHNRYRIPLRIRKRLNMKELEVVEKTQDAIKCRKSIRKPKLLMQSYLKRSNKNRWLETHLWHSKRMKMIEYFGYKIANNPNDKSTKACYKFCKNESVIYDKSYYQMVFLTAPLQNIKLQLQNHLEPKSIQSLFVLERFEGKKALQNITFYSNYQDKILAEMIGKVTFLWKQQFEPTNSNQNCNSNKQHQGTLSEPNKQLLIIFHPGMYQQLKQIFEGFDQKIKIKMVEDNYNLIELIGNNVMGKLNLLFKNLNIINPEEQNILCKYFDTIHDPCQYPQDTIIYINGKGEYEQKLTMPPIGFSQTITTKFKQNEQQSAYIGELGSYTYENYKIQEHSNRIWDIIQYFNNAEYQFRFKVTNRTRYTHKKQGKVKQKDKNKILNDFRNQTYGTEAQSNIVNEEQQINNKISANKNSKQQNQNEQIEINQQIQQQSQQNQKQNQKIHENIKNQQDKMEIEKVSQQKQQDTIVIEEGDDGDGNEDNNNNDLQEQFEEQNSQSLQELNQNEFEIKKLSKTHNSEISKEFMMIIIISNYGSKIGNVTIISNQGRGHIIWKKLSFLSCKAIGLKDYNQIQFELDQKVFPLDFPLTQVGKSLKNSESLQNSKKYLLKPDQKRVDYQKIVSPFPFKPDWDYLIQDFSKLSNLQIHISDLIFLKIKMFQKGVIFDNGYISIPLPEDIEKINILIKQNEKVTHIYEEPINSLEQGEDKQSYINSSFSSKLTRKLIGFITQGGFSLNEGKGKAKGYILKYYLDQINNNQNIKTQQFKNTNRFFVLVRKTTSVCYYMAEATIDYQDKFE